MFVCINLFENLNCEFRTACETTEFYYTACKCNKVFITLANHALIEKAWVFVKQNHRSGRSLCKVVEWNRKFY